MYSFATKIHYLLDKQKMTVVQLALVMGVELGWLENLLSGRVRISDGDLFKILGEGLGMSWDLVREEINYWKIQHHLYLNPQVYRRIAAELRDLTDGFGNIIIRDNAGTVQLGGQKNRIG